MKKIILIMLLVFIHVNADDYKVTYSLINVYKVDGVKVEYATFFYEKEGIETSVTSTTECATAWVEAWETYRGKVKFFVKEGTTKQVAAQNKSCTL